MIRIKFELHIYYKGPQDEEVINSCGYKQPNELNIYDFTNTWHSVVDKKNKK